MINLTQRYEPGLVVPWQVSSPQLVDLLPDSRRQVLPDCRQQAMIEKTAEFLAVAKPLLAD
jgi:hypothetical protein